MSELQKYVTELGAMVFPMHDVPLNIVPASAPLLYWCADVDAARAADRATIAELQAKCENLQRAYEIARDAHDEVSLEGSAMSERIEQLEAALQKIAATRYNAWTKRTLPALSDDQAHEISIAALAAADGAKGKLREIICTRCGLREQQGEVPSVDF